MYEEQDSRRNNSNNVTRPVEQLVDLIEKHCLFWVFFLKKKKLSDIYEHVTGPDLNWVKQLSLSFCFYP